VDKFNAILIEGLFYERDANLHVEQDSGQHLSVVEVLAPLVGQRVQLALHHLPPHGIEADKPGAGSCRYPGGKGCPVRHDLHPDRLLSFHMEGVLRPDPWRLVKFDGSVVPLPLAGLVGHYGRIGGATILDVEKMREQLAQMNPTAMAEALAASGLGAEDLEAMLAKLRGAGRG